MFWGQFAILVFVLLPMLLAFTATILHSIRDPSWMLWDGFQIRMWLYLILPSASAVSYAVSIYARFRGSSWGGHAKALAVFLIVPSLLSFYFEFMILLIIVIHGGSPMVYM
jgi:hypothetical protein